MMTRVFEPPGLHPQLIQTVTDLGFNTPTPIQSSVIPLFLSGQDVTGQAHTRAGKTHGHRPVEVVGTIAYRAQIPGRTIRAIKIRAKHPILDVPEQFVQQVLAKNGYYKVRNQRITIERAKQS
jgi:hypothetical protein